MKKHLLLALSLLLTATTLFAVPARRDWQTKTTQDGTTITVRQVGDEFYHFWETTDGKIAKPQSDGTFIVTDEARPSAEVIRQRRISSPMYQTSAIRRGIGTTPNPAPRGVVILVNFSNATMDASHTQAVFNEWCNATNCTVNTYGGANFGSAAQYFADQSNGAYRPVFDVFGPVTINKKYSTYGANRTSEQGSDTNPAQMIVDACTEVDGQVDFTQYDSDNDGEIDFVYVIYAGHSEAETGITDQIWPHNWYVYDGAGKTKYLDGKLLNNYACSSELSGESLCGVGTLCHEFGHVIGLPDLYDTDYKDNYYNYKTPGYWNVMDGGSYAGEGHCPPNYDPWQKYFFGWTTPVNLGTEGQNITLKANGTDGYVTYQINSSNKLQTPTTSGVVYYLENRQKQSWDSYLPGSGMLVWKINFKSSAWENNGPNDTSTSGSPLYTIVPADGGTQIDDIYDEDEETGEYVLVRSGGRDPFPGETDTREYTPISGHEITEISESGGIITFKYNGGVQKQFDLLWKANGEDFAITSSSGNVVFPDDNPGDCEGGRKFVGWCKVADYEDATNAPAFVKAGDAADEGDVFYAVYAEAGDAVGTTEVTDVLTLGTTGVSGTSYADWSGVTVTSNAVYAGQSAGGNSSIQLRSKNSNSGIITTKSGGKVSKVVVEWNSNTSDNNKIDIYGKNTAYTSPTELYGSDAGTKLGSITKGQTTELSISEDYEYIGIRSNNNAVYLDKLSISWAVAGGVSYSKYSTVCAAAEPCLLERIKLGGSARKEFTTGETFSWDGLDVTAEYSNCSEKAVAPTSVSTPDMTSAGTKEITVTYTENEVTKTATYFITVSDPKTYTIIWHVGATSNSETYIENANLVFPTDMEDCSETQVFMGWTASPSVSGDEEPEFINADAKVTADADYYAVWATKNESTGGGSGASVTDELTLATTGVSGTAYTDWSGVTVTSDAVYAGQSAAGNSSIQLRSKNSNSGIITTKSGGKVSKVVVAWNSNTSDGNKIDIYGKNAAYTSPTELYGSDAGTKLGSITKGQTTELTISGSYEYIGIRSNSGAVYLDKISITWGGSDGSTVPMYSDYTLSCDAQQICTLKEIELNTTDVKKNFLTTDVFTYSGLEVTAKYQEEGCDDKDVTNGVTVSMPDMTKEGEQIVTVTYGDKTATYTISVTKPVTHVVKWHACDGVKEVTYADGEALKFPDTPKDYAGKAFYGWTATEHYTGKEAPAIISEGGEVKADADYYAVYTK